MNLAIDAAGRSRRDEHESERETRRIDDALAMIGEVQGKHLAWLRGDPTKPKRETTSLDPAMLTHAKASQRKIERAAPPPLPPVTHKREFPMEAAVAWTLALGAVALTALIAAT